MCGPPVTDLQKIAPRFTRGGCPPLRQQHHRDADSVLQTLLAGEVLVGKQGHRQEGGYVGDGRMLRLIRKWLKAGVMEDGTLVPTEAGTPQVKPCSPTAEGAPRLAATDRGVPPEAASSSDLRWASRLRSCCRRGRRSRRRRTHGG